MPPEKKTVSEEELNKFKKEIETNSQYLVSQLLKKINEVEESYKKKIIDIEEKYKKEIEGIKTELRDVGNYQREVSNL
jgi:hypothetical protein